MKKMKRPRQLERHFKGVANHRRIEMLVLISKNPDITLEEISERLGCNVKTISEHARKLALSGLINKRYQGRSVCHELSPYGQIFLSFISSF